MFERTRWCWKGWGMVETITPRASVQDFANEMERKLAAVEERHPDGWGRDEIITLFMRAEDRMDQLFVAIDSGAPNDVVGEFAVDVANWMMMVADNVGYLTEMYGK